MGEYSDRGRVSGARALSLFAVLLLPCEISGQERVPREPEEPPPVPGASISEPSGPSTAVPPDPEPAWYLRVADGACELLVQEYGRGRDTVVVLHGGWGAEHGYLLDPLAEHGEERHLVFYDQRGSLRSPCADSLVSVEAHVDDLERLRAELDAERLHLVAHSMGTRLALEYLVAHPERTGGLVLLGPVNPRPFDAARDSAVSARTREAREAFFGRPACDRVREAEGLARADSLLSDEERSAAWRIAFTCANSVRVERWRRMEGGRAFYSAAAGRAAAASMDPGFDATEALARHPCRVHVIVGEDDWVVGGGEVIRHLYEGIPGVEVTVLPETGHALWIDAPAGFGKALGAALEAAACGKGDGGGSVRGEGRTPVAEIGGGPGAPGRDRASRAGTPSRSQGGIYEPTRTFTSNPKERS